MKIADVAQCSCALPERLPTFQLILSFLRKNSIHLVPPPNWGTYDIPRAIKEHIEYEWSLASYTNECGEQNPLIIVPVYFWPGDQVDLPCLMCELAFVFNGKMKIWGRSTKILRFLENPKVGPKRFHIVQNENISEMKIKDTMPEVLDKEGNKLYIMNPASQGVYFCYDAQSRSHTSIFYVLMAMTPPVRFIFHYLIVIQVEDHQLIRANFNWRYHFVPNIRHEAPARCKNSKLEFCQAKYVSHLSDQTAWENQELPNEYKWMPKLNALFNHEPFRSKGIRLYRYVIDSVICSMSNWLSITIEDPRYTSIYVTLATGFTVCQRRNHAAMPL
ncbi:unnamed protein product [Haemonchus placei]|uniref:Ig-like domain-containing protein n=1 Tax=Haemonchus placei TaxID=6290 RepID=A0A158QR18_HAEPC|nr:unnamed protein product [Haemonchus placei]